MSKLKTHILTTACAAIVGSAGFAADAFAGAKDIYGAGSSLVAPYVRQAMDCYALPTDLIFSGAPPTLVAITPFNYTGTPAQDCSTTHTKTDRTVNYISTGSGTGIEGIYSHDPKVFGHTDVAQTQYYPEVHFAFSDAGLASTDVTIYNSTGGTEHGATVVGFGDTPGAGQYGNPLQLYGPLVQFPISVDPVAIVYDPVYKKVYSGGIVTSYKFNIHVPRSDGSGGLRLDAATYCKIFNGQITNWNDPAIKKLNGNVSLQDPADSGSFNVPMQIVGRSDGSGTTSIFTRHLANVCASLSGNAYADGNTSLPSGLSGGVYNKSTDTLTTAEVLGKFTEASGSDGVSQYVAFRAVPDSGTPTIIQGHIGYAGPDYALPAVLNTNTNTYGLNTATLKNASNQWVAPTSGGALNAFKVLSPPQSDASGHYDASQPGNRAAPDNWVESLSHTSLLANPTTSHAYPIVGTTNFLGYTCYKTASQRGTIIGFLNTYLTSKIDTDASIGILAEAGISPISSTWRTAIKETFVNNNSGLGLNIATKSAPGVCSVSGIQGG